MGLTRSEQWTLCFVVGLILTGFLLQSHRARHGNDTVWIEAGSAWRPLEENQPEPPGGPIRSAPPSESPGERARSSPDRSGARMDLNSASSSELELLPGIGPAKAGAIISHRTDINGFNSVDQLLDVKGIGPRTLERLRPLLTIGEPLLPSAEHEGARRGPVLEAHSHSVDNNKLEQETSLPIDINRAGLEELQAINGIGPVLAKRIIESRTQRPFRSVDELIRVKGIGRITLERIRPQVVVDQGKNPHP